MPFERSSKGLRSSTIMAATVTVFLLAAMLYAPAPAEAGPSDISVRGWVWDSAYREVEGASVVVNVIDGGSTVTTESTTTDGDGFYSVFLLAAEWNVGNTFQIVVTFDSKQDTNQTIATSAAIQYVNLTYTFEIPEFGSLAGMTLVAFALGGVGVAAVVLWRRK
jgi:hypothetical protein